MTRGELEHSMFSLSLLPSCTFHFSSVVSPTSWSPSGKNSAPVWALHRLQFLQELSICSRMESLHGLQGNACFTTVLFTGCRECQLQYLGHLLLSHLLWLWCSHRSFSLFFPSSSTCPAFFSYTCFPKEAGKLSCGWPDTANGNWHSLPPSHCPSAAKTFATHTRCSGNSVYPSTEAETRQDAGPPSAGASRDWRSDSVAVGIPPVHLVWQVCHLSHCLEWKLLEGSATARFFAQYFMLRDSDMQWNFRKYQPDRWIYMSLYNLVIQALNFLGHGWKIQYKALHCLNNHSGSPPARHLQTAISTP